MVGAGCGAAEHSLLSCHWSCVAYQPHDHEFYHLIMIRSLKIFSSLTWQNIFVMRCLLGSSSPVVFSQHSGNLTTKELPHITYRKCHCDRKQELGWSNNEQCPSSGVWWWRWLESSVRWDQDDDDKMMKMTVQQQTTNQVTYCLHRSLSTVLVCRRCNLLSARDIKIFWTLINIKIEMNYAGCFNPTFSPKVSLVLPVTV